MNPTLKGATKSKTMWVAAVLMVLSMAAPLAPVICRKLHADGDTAAIIGGFLSIVIAVLRMTTSQSLEEKGSDPVLPPPAVKDPT